jgi:hypothetical protein
LDWHDINAAKKQKKIGLRALIDIFSTATAIQERTQF